MQKSNMKKQDQPLTFYQQNYITIYKYNKQDMVEEIPKWKLNLMTNIKNKIKDGAKLVFVHTPKCGGTYANNCLNILNIKTIGHIQPKLSNYKSSEPEVYFTIIREPIERFESFLNYRLGKKELHDFPPRFSEKINNNKYTLNDFMSQLNGYDYESFTPYRNLKYWTKNIDLCICMKEFLPFMEFLGYDISKIKNIPRKNVSVKNRGFLNDENKENLRQIYKEDINIYNYWIRP